MGVEMVRVDPGQGRRKDSVCVILDARQGPSASQAELFRLWVHAMQETLALHSEPAQTLSIITLHESHYESCLPLGSHSAASISAVLTRLERERVLGPLGIGALPWSTGTCYGMSESAGAGDGFFPVRETTGKRYRRTTESSACRLFAVGEDSALAALRSAMSLFAAPPFAHSIATTAIEGRVEYWTTEPEWLLPVAKDLSACLQPGVEFLILAGLSPSADMAQQVSSMRQLEKELRDGARDPSSLVCARTLPLSAAAFAKHLRAPLDVQVPILLRLPQAAEPRELPLVALSAILPSGVHERLATSLFEVVSRLDEKTISAELLYGLPLLVHVAAGVSRLCSESFDTLVRLMQVRGEALLLAANVDPLNLEPGSVQHLFVAFSRHSGLVLSGVLVFDNWDPASMLGAGSYAQSPVVNKCFTWPRFDPFELRCE